MSGINYDLKQIRGFAFDVIRLHHPPSSQWRADEND